MDWELWVREHGRMNEAKRSEKAFPTRRGSWIQVTIDYSGLAYTMQARDLNPVEVLLLRLFELAGANPQHRSRPEHAHIQCLWRDILGKAPCGI